MASCQARAIWRPNPVSNFARAHPAGTGATLKGKPHEWLRAFGRRAVKLDVKGYSRAKQKFVEITSEDDDMPWGEIRKALSDMEWTGWTTAEVSSGGLKHLTTVRQQMEKAFGL